MDPREYYSRGYVAEEIAGFLGGRWAAVATSGGRWARWEGDKPLTIDSPREVALHAGRGARSFYGTIEVFARLETSDDVTRLYDLNVVAADSFIDIDILDESRVGEAWRSAIRAAAAIVEWLREWGVEESVYLVWSGAGVHVRVNRMALEAPGLDLHPLARSLVLAEYALRSNRERLEAIVEASGGLIKVENIVARNRVFTAPLSLHRRLPMAAVPFPPGELEGFTPEWARPESPRYWPRLWERQKRGEAARLLEHALRALGPSPERSVIAPSPAGRPRLRPAAPREARIGRFPVMALLQAARYYLLNGDLDMAKSFGLNRAIFYAYLKYHGPARSAARIIARYGGRRVPEDRVRLEPVPGMREKAPRGPSGWYAMGGVEQRPEDFDRNVARRFEEAGIPWEKAWRAALDYVSRFPPSVLRDPQEFYKRVYEPVRDRFVELILREEPPRRAPRRLRGERREAPRPPERRPRTLLDWLQPDSGEDGEKHK